MMQTLNSFLEDLKGTDIGRSILAKQDAKRFDARQALVDEIAALRESITTADVTHERKLQPLRVAFDTAKAKYEAAAKSLALANNDHNGDIQSAESRIERLRIELTKSADERIDEAKWTMQRRFDDKRGRLFASATVPVPGFDGNTLAPRKATVTNDGAIRRLLDAMSGARTAFDNLKHENPRDVEQAIAEVMAPVEQCWQRIEELDPVPASAA